MLQFISGKTLRSWYLRCLQLPDIYIIAVIDR